jgi:hypothetical protein
MRTRLAVVLALIASCVGPGFAGSNYHFVSQVQNVSGKYILHTHREGKGGFVNELEVENLAKGKLKVVFNGTFFYMAGRDETFHEGSGEGEGVLNGAVGSVILDDRAGGKCWLTLTFSVNQVTVKAARVCGLNVDPNGVYTKTGGPTSTDNEMSSAANRPTGPRGFEVCPDPKTPCNSRARRFSPYELSFRLPPRLQPGRTYTSAPFYAVIVKTFENESCDADDHTASIERERLQIQRIYPSRKVFGSYSCPNLDTLDYDFEGKLDPSGERVLLPTYLAVYAGKTEREANEFLIYVKTIYRNAILKRMTANYEIMDQ